MKTNFAALAVLPITALQVAFVPADSAPVSVNVITFNVHGSVDRHGGGNAGSPTKINADVIALVKKYSPAAIGLEELCLKQHRSLRAKLAELGYVSSMTYARKSGGCNDSAKGNYFGNAIYLKASGFAWRDSINLPWGKSPVGSTGRENRKLICGRGVRWGWKFCATHTSPSEPDRTNQISKVYAQSGAWANGMTIAIAGDWNISASELKTKMPGRIIAGSGIDLISSTIPVRFIAAEAQVSSDHPAVIVSVTTS